MQHTAPGWRRALLVFFFLVGGPPLLAGGTAAARTRRATPTPTPPSATRLPANPAPVVNLNTATAAQLRLLPRIGPALAERILRARARRPFRQLAALRRVRGIGRVTLRGLAPHVVLVGPTTATLKLRLPRLAAVGRATNGRRQRGRGAPR